MTIFVQTKPKIKHVFNVGLLITVFTYSFVQTTKGTSPTEQSEEKEINKEEIASISNPIINSNENNPGNEENNGDNTPLQTSDDEKKENKNSEENTISNTQEQIQSSTPQEEQKGQAQNTDTATPTAIRTEDRENIDIPKTTKNENQNKEVINSKTTSTKTENTLKKGASPLAPQIALSAKILGVTDKEIKKTYSDPEFHKFTDNFLKNVPAAEKVIQKSINNDPNNGIMLLNTFNKIKEIQESSLPETEKEKKITEVYKNTNDIIEKNYSSEIVPIVCCASDSQKDTKKMADIITETITEIVEKKMILQEKKMYLIAGITVGAIAIIGGICTYLAKKKNSDDEKNSDDD